MRTILTIRWLGILLRRLLPLIILALPFSAHAIKARLHVVGPTNGAYYAKLYIDGVYNYTFASPSSVNYSGTEIVWDTAGNWQTTNFVGHTVQVYVRRPNQAAYDLVLDPVVQGASYWEYWTQGGADPTTNRCKIKICGVNRDRVWHTYWLYRAGSPLTSINGTPARSGRVDPGQQFCIEAEVLCTESSGIYADYSQNDKDFGYVMLEPLDDYNLSTNSTTYPEPPATNSVVNTDVHVFDPANSTNILWSSSSSTNTIISQQQGDSAIKEAVDANTLSNERGFNGVSNAILSLIESQTNGPVRAFHIDNTNALSRINSNLTFNGSAISGSASNQTSAEAAANSILSSVNSSADSASTGLGSAPSVLTGGDATALSFELAGHEINLDPEVRFPGIGAFFKNALTAVIALALGRFLVNLYRETAAVYASSQTGGVPAVGPWGSVGIGIAALVPVIIVTMWVVVFTLVFSYMLAPLLDLQGQVGSLSMGNATALYLINYFLPVSFALSAAWTRIVAPLAVTKLVIVSASAQRFLFGK